MQVLFKIVKCVWIKKGFLPIHFCYFALHGTGSLLKIVFMSLRSTTFYYHKLCYAATHYLIKRKIHSFLTQQMDAFYPLNNLRRLLFSEFSLKSLNPSRSFRKCFITFTSYPILLCFFSFLFIPRDFRIWWFWILNLLRCTEILIERKKNLKSRKKI